MITIHHIRKPDAEWIKEVLTAYYGSHMILRRDENRQLKPGIPKCGNDGIEIRDELYLEKVL